MTSVESHVPLQLIRDARVCGLGEQSGLPGQTRSIIKDADQAKRLLSSEELSLICDASGMDARTPRQLQKEADDFVEQVCMELKDECPDLFQPGGALHPNERAEACWRDCWNFLRVLVYAVAADRSQFTDPEGMVALVKLYTQVGVPMNAMCLALQRLRSLSMGATASSKEQTLIGACFDHLLDNLNNPAVKS